MSPLLAVVIVVISLALSALFVMRDAKKFALAPPSPLVDLDRMYDVIFEQLDETSGSAITPAELSLVLTAFIAGLDKHSLIKEDLAPEFSGAAPEKEETLSVEMVVADIEKNNPTLDVPTEVIAHIVELSFAYLRDISAVT